MEKGVQKLLELPQQMQAKLPVSPRGTVGPATTSFGHSLSHSPRPESGRRRSSNNTSRISGGRRSTSSGVGFQQPRQLNRPRILDSGGPHHFAPVSGSTRSRWRQAGDEFGHQLIHCMNPATAAQERVTGCSQEKWSSPSLWSRGSAWNRSIHAQIYARRTNESSSLGPVIGVNSQKLRMPARPHSTAQPPESANPPPPRLALPRATERLVRAQIGHAKGGADEWLHEHDQESDASDGRLLQREATRLPLVQRFSLLTRRPGRTERGVSARQLIRLSLEAESRI